MIYKTPLLDFDDLLIVPDTQTRISSRTDISIHDENGFLPLFTAPMDTVVNRDNEKEFISRKIYSILPRTSEIHEISYNHESWRSYSLEQFQSNFIEGTIKSDKRMYALIDVANGHMNRVYEMVIKAKVMYGDRIVLMVGNVANPLTYATLARAGADYVRVGIGNGGGCLTTQQTGVGYPMASLIDECCKIKNDEDLTANIVADGGMKKYSDIIKALACGADYVMLGSILNKSLESCSPTCIDIGNNYCKPYEDYFKETKEFLDLKGETSPLLESIITRRPKTQEELMKDGVLYKMFRGMSTKEVQQTLGATTLKTSEGVVKYQKVEYTLDSWVENFSDYLRSAMSYTNSINLKEFIGGVRLQTITQNAFTRFNK